MRIPNLPESFTTKHAAKGWPLGLAGVALLIIGSFLSWSYDPKILGDLSLNLYPGGLQILAIIGAVVGLLLLLTVKGPLESRIGPWLDAALGLRALGLWMLIYMVLVLVAITTDSTGLINVNPGGWVSFVGALLLFLGARVVPLREHRDLAAARAPGWAEVLAIAVVMAGVLFGAAYALGREDAWSFVLFLVFAAGVIAMMVRTGILTWFGHIAQRQKKILTLSAFLVAFLFPFT
ncbi:MAG: branched-chain amino acid transport system permease protein, partial [Kribbellaceae bacterium]|nr:branched-chain amino acid transport system permease protein [Kribbellaceae bacterium]